MAGVSTHGCLTVRPPPPRTTDLISMRVTREVAELVIPRPTEGGARRVEVMRVTLDSHPVRDASHSSLVVQGVPSGIRQNYAGV